MHGLVVCLSRRSQSVGADRADRSLGSVEGAGDPGPASRACAAAAAVGSTWIRAGRPCVAGRAESSASTPGVGSVLGQARDIAALAPSAGGAALDVSAQEAGTAAACSA